MTWLLEFLRDSALLFGLVASYGVKVAAHVAFWAEKQRRKLEGRSL